jgi:Derlin-2/3
VVVYVWARRNPDVLLNFLGLFTFTAPYLPWVMLMFGVVLGHSPVYDLLGIGVGHIYYFFEDVYPRATNRRPLAAPAFL